MAPRTYEECVAIAARVLATAYARLDAERDAA